METFVMGFVFFFFKGRKIVRNVLTRAADVEVAATTQVEAPAANTEAASTELPDIVKTVQEAVKTLYFYLLSASASCCVVNLF